MNITIFKKIRPYIFFSTLTLSIFVGSIAGYFMGENALYLKPLADIFINLLLTFLVPLIFFCVSSSVARMNKNGSTLKILSLMLGAFIFTGIIAAAYMLFVVNLFPLTTHISIPATTEIKTNGINIADQIVHTFTVNSFGSLFSHEHMLALVLFSILVGLATSFSGKKGKLFSEFLESGAEIFLKTVSMVMYLAPIGFFAYFAILVGKSGLNLLANYFQVTLIYYVAALIYFIIAFTFYAYLANQRNGVQTFWKNIFLPMITSLATCSSAASIPANLQAARQMGVSSQIYETVIPIGAILHKDGSVLGGIIKIAFLFSVYHMTFAGLPILLTALVVALFVGMVMGAIPSGGMLGELLILSVYGFPPEALMIIAAISVLIDPLATMLNVTGDCVCSMLVARAVKEKSVSEPVLAFESRKNFPKST